MYDNQFIAITQEPIDMNEALKFVSHPAHGGIATFIGQVRDFNMGKAVQGVSYDVADDLAIQALGEICQKVHEQWGETLKIYIAHFKGYLEVGGTSVAVATSSVHRDEAFKSCRYIIESLKHHVPIWKKEFYQDGESDWVKGHALCQHA